MGAGKSIESLEVWQAGDAEHWEVVENAGYCNVVKHLVTGEEAEEYAISLDGSHSITEEFLRYEYRLKQNQNLVRVLSAYKQHSQHICAGGEVVRVRTERIPYRLSEVQSLSHGEVLLVLMEALVGYKTIFERHGPVHLDDNMIGFTPEGRVKVWLNDNFARNSPDPTRKQFQGLMGAPTQSTMITELFQQVESHSAGKCYPTIFKARYAEEHIDSFFEATAFLNDYAEEEQIDIPGFVRLPRSLQQHGRGFEKSNNYRIPDIVLRGTPKINIAAHDTKAVRDGQTEKDNHMVRLVVRKDEYQTQQQNIMRGGPQRLVRQKATSSVGCIPPFSTSGSSSGHRIETNSTNIKQPLQFSKPVQQQPTIKPTGKFAIRQQESRTSFRREVSVDRLKTLPSQASKEMSRTTSKPTVNGLKPSLPPRPMQKPMSTHSNGVRVLDRLVAQRR